MMQDYTPPKYGESGFNCPHYDAFAHQRWSYDIGASSFDGEKVGAKLQYFAVSHCKRCGAFAIWKNERLIYPQKYVSPLPTDNMPDEVKADYEEARAIFAQSSRGAAALLRLSLQKLVIYLDESGEDLNKSIGNLVKKGLMVDIQKALDIVRVVGNNAVHPGVIDVRDNPEIALKLFKLVNIIVEQMITQPKEISELYDNVIPEGAKEQINNRDNPN